MVDTIIALFLAHVLADYVFQTRWMVETKRGIGFAAHISVVFVTAVLCLGQLSTAVFAVTGLHLMIDAVKTVLWPDRLWSYLADQGLHILSIIGVATLFPAMWDVGVWAGAAPAWTLEFAALVAGLVYTIRAGHFAIVCLIAELPMQDRSFGNIRGAVIGGLERAAVFVFVLSGVGILALVLLAGKAAVWYGQDSAVRDGRHAALVTTCASFTWALVVAYGTRALITML